MEKKLELERSTERTELRHSVNSVVHMMKSSVVSSPSSETHDKIPIYTCIVPPRGTISPLNVRLKDMSIYTYIYKKMCLQLNKTLYIATHPLMFVFVCV